MTVSYGLHISVCPVVTSFISDNSLPTGWSALLCHSYNECNAIGELSWFISSQCSVTSALCFSLMLTNTTDYFLHACGSGFSQCALQKISSKNNAISCAAAPPHSASADIFVSVSEHDHNCGAMMSIAIFTVMNEESTGWEQCLPSHQFTLSPSLYTLEGREDGILKMFFSCHHDKDFLWLTSLFQN